MSGLRSCAQPYLPWVCKSPAFGSYSGMIVRASEIALADTGSLGTGSTADYRSGFEMGRLPRCAGRISKKQEAKFLRMLIFGRLVSKNNSLFNVCRRPRGPEIGRLHSLRPGSASRTYLTWDQAADKAELYCGVAVFRLPYSFDSKHGKFLPSFEFR